MSAERFAQLLTEGIQRVRVREGKSVRIVQDELGYALERQGGASIEYWRKGHLPPTLREVEALARLIVARGRMEREWLHALLRSADHPAPALLCDELFPPAPAAAASVVPAPAPRWSGGELPPVGALPRGSHMPLSRNPLFVGRAAALRALAAALLPAAQPPKPASTMPASTMPASTLPASTLRVAVVAGMGGLGKTQLACEFVHRFGPFFPGGVFWLRFDPAEGVAAEVARCGERGLLDLAPDFGALSQEDQVRLVRAAWQEPIPRLLIFDNCEEPALLEAWRPTSGGCSLLLTSRRASWGALPDAALLPLDVLGRAESLALLRALQPSADGHPTADDATLDAIAAALGDLPLVLHLAGSYLARYRHVVTAQEYLAMLADPALLEHSLPATPSPSPTHHNQSLARTIALSYERLEADDPIDALARRLLALLAACAPQEDAARALLWEALGLESGRVEVRRQAEDAAVRLDDLGLIVRSAAGLRCHRLVAAYVRAVEPGAVAEATLRLEALLAAALERTNRAAAPRELALWRAHAHAVARRALERTTDGAIAHTDGSGIALGLLWAHHLWLLGDYAGAVEWGEGLVERCRALCGEDDARTATAWHHLATAQRERGAPAAARAALEQALRIRRAGAGSAVELADALNDLGDLLWGERRVPEAIAHLQEALAIGRARPGEADLVVAEAANNLSICLMDGLGRPQEALPYIEEAVRIRRACLGDEHPYTALAESNRGYVLQALGELDAAHACLTRALEVRLRAFGEEHADTAHSYLMMGKLLSVQGEAQAARAALEQACATSVRLQGEGSGMTAACRHELGLLRLAAGDLDAARAELAQALAAREQAHRAGSPQLVATRRALALALLAQGEPEQARTLLARAEVDRAALPGAQGSSLRAMTAQIERLARACGRESAARALAEAAQAIA